MKKFMLLKRWVLLIPVSLLIFSCSKEDISPESELESSKGLKFYLENKIVELEKSGNISTSEDSEIRKKFNEIDWNNDSISLLQDLESSKNTTVAKYYVPEPDVPSIDDIKNVRLRNYIKNLSLGIRKMVEDYIDIIIAAESKPTYSKTLGDGFFLKYYSNYYLIGVIHDELFNEYVESFKTVFSRLISLLTNWTIGNLGNYGRAVSIMNEAYEKWNLFRNSRQYTDYTPDIRAYDKRVEELFVNNRIRVKVEGGPLYDLTHVEFFLGVELNNDIFLYSNQFTLKDYSLKILNKTEFYLTGITTHKSFLRIDEPNYYAYFLKAKNIAGKKYIKVPVNRTSDLLCEPVIESKDKGFHFELSMRVDCNYVPF